MSAVASLRQVFHSEGSFPHSTSALAPAPASAFEKSGTIAFVSPVFDDPVSPIARIDSLADRREVVDVLNPDCNMPLHASAWVYDRIVSPILLSRMFLETHNPGLEGMND